MSLLHTSIDFSVSFEFLRWFFLKYSWPLYDFHYRTLHETSKRTKQCFFNVLSETNRSKQLMRKVPSELYRILGASFFLLIVQNVPVVSDAVRSFSSIGRHRCESEDTYISVILSGCWGAMKVALTSFLYVCYYGRPFLA